MKCPYELAVTIETLYNNALLKISEKTVRAAVIVNESAIGTSNQSEARIQERDYPHYEIVFKFQTF